MAPTLYCFNSSPPARTAMITAHAIGLELDKKIMNLVNKEQFKPEYLKINPQHTVPTLVDSDITLSDSHVISAYFVSRYAKDDSLYPKDVKQRALVDVGLYFDAVTLFPRMMNVCRPIIYHGKTTVDQEHRDAIYDAFAILDKLLEGKQWVAGEKMTIADFACVSTLSSLVEVGFDLTKFPNVKAWFSRCQKEIPGYAEVNGPGAKELGEQVRSKMQPGQVQHKL